MRWRITLTAPGGIRAREECQNWRTAANRLRGWIEASHPDLIYLPMVRSLRDAAYGRPWSFRARGWAAAIDDGDAPDEVVGHPLLVPA